MSDTESIIVGESLSFDDVVLSVSDINRVVMSDFTHGFSPARSVRCSR